MPRLTPLPKELRYLLPFRRQVAKLKPDELNENMDFSLLHQLLLDRIEGLSVEEGKNRLVADRVTLATWLESVEVDDNGSMYFLHGYFMGLPDMVDILLAEQRNPPPRFKIEMELPPGAEVKRAHDASMQVDMGGMTLILEVASQKSFEMFFPPFHSPTCLGEHIERVTFGGVSGFKQSKVETYDPPNTLLKYAFEIGDKFLLATVFGPKRFVTSSTFEKYFHTLQVVPQL